MLPFAVQIVRSGTEANDWMAEMMPGVCDPLPQTQPDEQPPAAHHTPLGVCWRVSSACPLGSYTEVSLLELYHISNREEAIGIFWLGLLQLLIAIDIFAESHTSQCTYLNLGGCSANALYSG